jgi:hypothetical protein
MTGRFFFFFGSCRKAPKKIYPLRYCGSIRSQRRVTLGAATTAHPRARVTQIMVDAHDTMLQWAMGERKRQRQSPGLAEHRWSLDLIARWMGVVATSLAEEEGGELSRCTSCERVLFRGSRWWTAGITDRDGSSSEPGLGLLRLLRFAQIARSCNKRMLRGEPKWLI